MAIENETREMFMSLPTWNARDALRMLLEVNPYSVIQEDDFDGTEIEQEARALIRWLYRYGILPRAIREPDDAAPELIDDYLDAIGEVRRTPVEWITAATANPGAPEEWLALLQPPSGAQERGDLRKRAVLIDELKGFWPSIEQDLSDSTRNGLHEAAKHEDHGFWIVEPAIKWAAERGRIPKVKATSFIASNDESYLSPMLRILLKLD